VSERDLDFGLLGVPAAMGTAVYAEVYVADRQPRRRTIASTRNRAVEAPHTGRGAAVNEEAILLMEARAQELRKLASAYDGVARDSRAKLFPYAGPPGCLVNDKPAGHFCGVLYCYGGCGTPYNEMGLDVLLPTALWNRIAVGPPFDPTEYPGIEREGRGGVLCAACTVARLSALTECTALFLDIEDHRTLAREAAALLEPVGEGKEPS
jgi:hypothetical protein